MLPVIPRRGFILEKTRMNPVIAYLQSSIGELRKVTWPTRKEATTHALLVIGITVGVAVVFAAADAALTAGLAALLALTH